MPEIKVTHVVGLIIGNVMFQYSYYGTLGLNLPALILGTVLLFLSLLIIEWLFNRNNSDNFDTKLDLSNAKLDKLVDDKIKKMEKKTKDK